MAHGPLRHPVGGRSRNGWGSLSLQPVDEGTAALDGQLGGQLALPWQDAPQRDRLHARHRHPRALVWQTRAFDDWKKLMQADGTHQGRRCARSFHLGKDAMAPEARHWLSYPVTNHSVKAGVVTPACPTACASRCVLPLVIRSKLLV